MKKRRWLLFLIVCIFAVGTCIPSYGAEKAMITKEKAIEIGKQALKDYFNMKVDDSKYHMQVENRKDWNNPKRYVWSMNWTYDDAIEHISAFIVLDSSTGEILELNKDQQKYGQQTGQSTKLTEEEAKAKAEAFINKILPGKLEETELAYEDNSYRPMGTPFPIRYQFRYVRLIDGIKFEGNYINVGIDGATGEVQSFYYRWDDIGDLPKPEGIKTSEEATRIYRNRMNMDLIYLPIRDETKPYYNIKNIKLAYRPSLDFSMLDAKTGLPIGWDGKTRPSQESKELTPARIQEIKKQAKPIAKQDQEISRERAEKIAREVVSDQFGGKIQIDAANYIEGDHYWDTAGRKAWNVLFTIEDSKGKNGQIMIDALTEEIIALSAWINEPYAPNMKPEVTWEQAYDNAIALIAKYHPDKIDQLKLKQLKPEEPVPDASGNIYYPMEYYFNFPRLIDGILYEENQFSVSIHARTGGMLHFNCRWSEDLPLPPKTQTISKEQAKDVIFKYNDAELAYNRVHTSTQPQDPKTETRLIYQLAPKQAKANPYMLIDAVSGRPIDYQGKDLNLDSITKFEKAIQGHWIEKEATILAQQGIIDKSNFEPNRPITKIEAIKMLVECKGNNYYIPQMTKEMGAGGDSRDVEEEVEYTDITEDSEDYPYVKKAIRYGIIENLKEPLKREETLSREDLAVMVVRTLGYDALAQARQIFRVSFSDQDQIQDEKIGYVAICEGLKLVEGGNTIFRPKDKATMAEAASMIYRSLQHFNRW